MEIVTKQGYCSYDMRQARAFPCCSVPLEPTNLIMGTRVDRDRQNSRKVMARYLGSLGTQPSLPVVVYLLGTALRVKRVTYGLSVCHGKLGAICGHSTQPGIGSHRLAQDGDTESGWPTTFGTTMLGPRPALERFYFVDNRGRSQPRNQAVEFQR
ncbi:hypothetical protein BT67DRAFT_440840 [Trichocladium antarcticum]|uniref:Uncharacterized protein n=1 Tax=Trichocladium antarcticum TaxID=1450529 RepID=A0AAN6ZFU6_9PEZI|nr:hypothetical protein BT67DRAFT_440840 [Trichocladium antarcticum]